MITTAMVLAAGLGKRMRPITDRIPKPLVEIGGRTMLDHAIDRLAEAGVTRVIVNVHHLPEQIENHLATRTHPRILISDERERLLETGGGIRKALPLIGDEPFIAANADTTWLERHSNLARLVAAWDPARMDILLLVAAIEATTGYEGAGDFVLSPDGRLAFREGPRAPFVYAGVAIYRPQLFAGPEGEAFSAVSQFREAAARGRLHGHVLDGEWLHVGTPDAIAAAEARVAAFAQRQVA